MEDFRGIIEEVDKEKLKTSLETQLAELEMLQSMFYNPGEIRVDDYSVVVDMTEYVNDKTSIIPPTLDFTVKLLIETLVFEICVTLPHDYPDVEPDIFVRNSKQNREQQRKINGDLTDYIKSLDRGEICIYTAITWLQENSTLYVNSNNEPAVKAKKTQNNECARFWIYSHHIYSKTKRREILSLADDYSLTGFCLPGKPGVICIEGLAEDCNSWWTFIKSMCWKRIVCKFTESETHEDVQKFRKFKKFEELSFHCEGNRSNHMSMGDLVKYLETHNCAEMFKEFFGLEGKNA